MFSCACLGLVRHTPYSTAAVPGCTDVWLGSAVCCRLSKPTKGSPPYADNQSRGQPCKLLSRPSIQAVLNVQQPEGGIKQLLSSVPSTSLQQLLRQDLQQAVQLFNQTLQVDHVHAKLELIRKQSCPKWHADFVKMRMLCTYAGPGTWCIENRFVERELAPATGMISVAHVAEAHGIEAAAGDLLFLKGQKYPGLYGAGAVHKSPELQHGETRLVLTVDDGCC